MRIGERAWWFVLVWVAALAAGCQRPAVTGSGADLRPASRLFASDIPLPYGFDLVDRSSEDWASGPMRYVRHNYQGRGDPFAVRRFYRKHMPLARWTPVAESSVGGRCTMMFDRKQESCRVTIVGERSGWAPRVTVEVLVAPITR